MTTTGELVDRALRDWLEPTDDQPARLRLEGTMSATQQTLVYDASMIGPEEMETIAAGTLIEVDSEEMLVGDVDETDNRLTGLVRAVNGTIAATHTAGAFVYPNRLWRRRVIFDALCDQITSLYPELYQVRTSELITVSTSGFTEIPADDAELIVTPMWFQGANAGSGRSGWRKVPMSEHDFLDSFPASSTGKAFTVRLGTMSGAGYLTYRARFCRPDDEVTDLEDDLGVDRSWEPILLVGAVAYLVAGRELDLATQRRLSEQLAQQNYPAGTPSKIRDDLLRYQSFLMNQAKADLQARWPVTVSMQGAW